jgi:hypothetical protein
MRQRRGDGRRPASRPDGNHRVGPLGKKTSISVRLGWPAGFFGVRPWLVLPLVVWAFLGFFGAESGLRPSAVLAGPPHAAHDEGSVLPLFLPGRFGWRSCVVVHLLLVGVFVPPLLFRFGNAPRTAPWACLRSPHTASVRRGTAFGTWKPDNRRKSGASPSGGTRGPDRTAMDTCRWGNAGISLSGEPSALAPPAWGRRSNPAGPRLIRST